MAIGILEIQNLVNAYRALDYLSKNAEVKLIHERKKLGGRLVTLVFEGSVSDLQVGFSALKKMYSDSKLLKVAEVVPNPAPELKYYFEEGKFK